MKIPKTACILGLILISTASILLANEVKRTAVITDIKGRVQFKERESSKWVPAEVGTVLKERDIIKTGRGSWTILNVDGGGETASVEVKENSQLMLYELVKDEERGTQKTLLDLAIGKILIRAQKLHSDESSFEVKTPTSIVGVRGTVFEVEVEALE